MLAVLQFPGSNDDRDMHFAVKSVLGAPAQLVWHKERELPSGTRGVLLPGGFSYGDYLRAGAMAAASPVIAAVKRFADQGGPVLGTCNGFQILCESGLLPGVLVRNHGLHFICESVHLRVERSVAPFTSRASEGQVIEIPIKHGEGAYYADADTLEEIEKKGQVLLRYVTSEGEAGPEANPNGAVAGIAGLVNQAGNVFGLMPHPEHAVEASIGGLDGRLILGSMIDAVDASEVAERGGAA